MSFLKERKTGLSVIAIILACVITVIVFYVTHSEPVTEVQAADPPNPAYTLEYPEPDIILVTAHQWSRTNLKNEWFSNSKTFIKALAEIRSGYEITSIVTISQSDRLGATSCDQELIVLVKPKRVGPPPERETK
jgi:hypothetical protein